MQSVIIGDFDTDAFVGAALRHARETAPGLVSAFLLHGVALAFIILFHMQIGSPSPDGSRIVPVDVVQFGEQTAAPPSRLLSAVPQQKRIPAARREQSSPVPPEGVSPRGAKPVPLDDLDTKLRALAQLRQPETNSRLSAISGQATVTSTSTDANAGDQALYAVRDFVRQHVVRHWSLDLRVLGGRSFGIAIHVVMTRGGIIQKAEIVDMQRYRTDAVFRDTALSARNAVLLSSPVPLPVGTYPELMEMTLNFNPKDALQ